MYLIRVRQGTHNEKELKAEPNMNLLRLLQANGFSIASPCGGKGFCGKCKVRVIDGEHTKSSFYTDEMSYLSSIEKEMGFRLACRVKVEEDLLIEIPEEGSRAIILTQGDSSVMLNPIVKKKHLTLAEPTVEDQLSDVERVEKALSLSGKISPSFMSLLPEILRRNKFDVTAVIYDNEVIAVESGDTTSHIYGLAVDIGTTTMVGFLMDLTTGEQVSVYSALNPQRPYGADVITRTDYTVENEDGLKTLSSLIRSEINHMLGYFYDECSIRPDQIYHVTLVGNTIMMHIFADLPVKNIAVSPFIPVVARRIDFRAQDVDIKINAEGKVTILPMVAGYVGSDTIGAVLSCKMAEKEEVSLMVDIGTNGEIALGNRHGIVSCSTAAGPAFEGAHIRYGLGGIAGAINAVQIKDEIIYTTIGEKPARGICGSGIVDVCAEMIRSGILEPQGRIITPKEAKAKLPPSIASRVTELDGKAALLLASRDQGAVEDIYVCQKDIREVQLAKAAIASGIHILMKESKVSYEDIDKVYLAGGFGNYINYDHAADIGLIPKELRKKIVPIGNGAGVGAKMALLSKDDLEKADEIRKITKYIELSTRMDFQTAFIDYLSF